MVVNVIYQETLDDTQVGKDVTRCPEEVVSKLSVDGGELILGHDTTVEDFTMSVGFFTGKVTMIGGISSSRNH